MVAGLAEGVFKAEKDWANLFSLLMQLAQNPDEPLRSLNFNILEQVWL